MPNIDQNVLKQQFLENSKNKQLANLPIRKREDPKPEEPNYDSMSFGKAFATARASGASTFKWKGKLYGTNIDKNWRQRWYGEMPKTSGTTTQKQTATSKNTTTSSSTTKKLKSPTKNTSNNQLPGVSDTTIVRQPIIQTSQTNNTEAQDSPFEFKIRWRGPGKNVSTYEDRPTDEITDYYRQVRKSLEDQYAQEDTYDNLQAIQSIPRTRNYVVLDKAEGKGYIYSPNNEILSTFVIATGKSGDDYNTITYVDEDGNLIDGAGNMATPAGISRVNGELTYHGYPALRRARYNPKTGKYDSNLISLIHYYPDTSDPHLSNGCVRTTKDGIDALKKYVGMDTEVFTLPEKGGSRFVVREGSLNFVADRASQHDVPNPREKYWRDYNVQEDKSYKPVNFERRTGSASEAEQAFVNNLEVIKEAMQREFNIDSRTYNEIAKLAIGITNNESNFGDSIRYTLKNSPVGALLTGIRKMIKGTDRSLGLSQIKMQGDNEQMQALYKKYGLNPSMSEMSDPKNCSLATMLRLLYMYKTEVERGKFTGQDGIEITPLEALLYKWMGRNNQLTQHLATPLQNRYITAAKKYANNYRMYNE